MKLFRTRPVAVVTTHVLLGVVCEIVSILIVLDLFLDFLHVLFVVLERLEVGGAVTARENVSLFFTALEQGVGGGLSISLTRLRRAVLSEEAALSTVCDAQVSS